MQAVQITNIGERKGFFLPVDYEIPESELLINRIGHSFVLFPKSDPWELFTMSLSKVSDDFMTDGRQQPAMQTRAAL